MGNTMVESFASEVDNDRGVHFDIITFQLLCLQLQILLFLYSTCDKHIFSSSLLQFKTNPRTSQFTVWWVHIGLNCFEFHHGKDVVMLWKRKFQQIKINLLSNSVMVIMIIIIVPKILIDNYQFIVYCFLHTHKKGKSRYFVMKIK